MVKANVKVSALGPNAVRRRLKGKQPTPTMCASESLPLNIPCLDADQDPVLKAAEALLKTTPPTKILTKKATKKHSKKSEDRELPEGWTIDTKVRKGGASKASMYKVYIAPDGKTQFDRWSSVEKYITAH